MRKVFTVKYLKQIVFLGCIISQLFCGTIYVSGNVKSHYEHFVLVQGGAKITHVFFFSNNCNFVYFQYKKNYVNTETTCNKCSFDYLHWLLNYGKLYRKDGVLLAVQTSGASPQSSASHLLTFLVAHLQFLREWKLSDRRLYEVFERRLLIWVNPKKEIAGRWIWWAWWPRDIAETWCVLFATPCNFP